MASMLTWNVWHLANRNKLEHLRTICRRAGCIPPQIVTPDLLWESRPMSTQHQTPTIGNITSIS